MLARILAKDGGDEARSKYSLFYTPVITSHPSCSTTGVVLFGAGYKTIPDLSALFK